MRSRSLLSGIWLMTLASVGFSLMALCVKLASQTMPALEVVFFRSLLGTLMMAPLIKAKRASFLGKRNRTLLVLRAVIGFTALTLHFYTIAHLPLGTAVMLNYTGPIFAAAFAIFFLNERPRRFLLTMILISFIGVYFLVEAKLEGSLVMILLGLFSGVCVGLVYTLIRAMRRHESPLTVIFYFTAISTLGSIFFLPFGFQWPDLREWLLLAGVGIGSFYGQLWMTISLRRAPASLISPFSYLTPLLSFVYGLIFFNDRLAAHSLFGAFLIILCGCSISYFETLPRTTT